MASSLSAGLAGAVAWNLVAGAARLSPWTLPLALAAGSLTKFSAKAGLEHLFVDKADRTASAADLAWGAVDGFAGVTASWADSAASRAYLTRIASAKLGANLYTGSFETAGRQLVQSDARFGVKLAFLRGMAGGTAGTFTWSLPHRTSENFDEISRDPGGALRDISKEVLIDTAAGVALGSVISGAGTTLLRGNELFGYAGASLLADRNSLHMRVAHLNDLHSQNDRLSAIKPVSARLLSDPKWHSEFVTAGDLEGSNVQYIAPGVAQNSALMKMGVSKFIPGNHTYDLGSGYDVPGYARSMSRLLGENPNVSLIATNLDLSAHPQYEQLAKRFVIDTIPGANGPEKVATLGLVTRDGTEFDGIPGIAYRDSLTSAVSTMKELSRDHGVNKFVILSHLGLTEDKALAQSLVRNEDLSASGLKVSAIIGGHSHDVTPAPIWVGRNGVSTGGLSTLRNTSGGYEIPIVQAGSHGRWLGQLDLAVRPDGAADRFRTVGRMHAITPGTAKDETLDAYIRSQSGELDALRQTVYDTRVKATLSNEELRSGESELGNMVSDAVDGYAKPDAVLTHASWIRGSLEANVDPATDNVVKPITRLDLANLFKSGGNPELEKREFSVFKLRGDEVRNILEYGVREYPAPQVRSFGQNLRGTFAGSMQNTLSDGTGDFLQVAGLRYDFNFAKNPMTGVRPGGTPGSMIGDGNRVGNIWMRDKASGDYLPLDPQREYAIAARNFTFAKWSRFGIFGNRTVEQTPVYKSPIEMVGELIRNKTIEPSTFRKEGRITNMTPESREPSFRVGVSIATPAVAPSVVNNLEAQTKRSS